ncbi:DNA primase [Pseudonocardia sp. Ae706_Ps2]|uniref:DUF3631 domain-containing protein n=1 Tax=unclassified Pseudonocardia TaxID=2619320 RepID=UPI00095CC42E|nr:DUF3631 domain-containing protein [Pseudonocardia sp. Ae406_Ps2]OLM09314.1 DNA primase [Pseudonocardia sp. Ae706_Ps2]OLM09319.1 DNA primase [Pseudonocardia sp. Ae706_Ps2]
MNTHDHHEPAGQHLGAETGTKTDTTPLAPPGGTDPDPDGAVLLDDLEAALRRYVSLPSEAAGVAVTLWIAATHAQPAWAHAPRLVIRAPEKRCGKSRLLDVVEGACHDPFITVNATAAAVYRSITADPPTMLVDEADTIFGPKADNHEDLRGLLNAGHQRNRPAKRYDQHKNRVETISTFAMAALAGIGRMPDTIEDRAVVVQMRRRTTGEQVAPYRHRRDRPRLQRLSERLHGWLRDDLPALEAAEPVMPVEDRTADTWEPLIAIADHAGADWPHRARQALLTLQDEGDDDQSERIRLLADCHAAFGAEAALPTARLLQLLRADPEAPWSDYGPRGEGLSAKKLGELLKEYGIRSEKIGFPGLGQTKGYRRSGFADAWQRYAPDLITASDNKGAAPESAISAGHPVAD